MKNTQQEKIMQQIGISIEKGLKEAFDKMSDKQIKELIMSSYKEVREDMVTLRNSHA